MALLSRHTDNLENGFSDWIIHNLQIYRSRIYGHGQQQGEHVTHYVVTSSK